MLAQKVTRMFLRSVGRWRVCLLAALFSLAAGAGLLVAQDKEDKPTAPPVAQETDNSNEAMSRAEMFKAFALTSKAFRAAADKVRPSLVTIESFGGVNAVQGRIGGIRKQGEGNTTGVMISADGLVVTSTFNFIQRPPIIFVITADGERRVAEFLGRDDMRKICLLKVKGVEDMPVPEYVAPADVKVGQWAVSIGVGYGDTNPAISMGIVSAKNRIGGRAIQTDANISPANYGGPLVDIEGRMIGICVPMNPKQQAVGAGVEWYDSGIGFAIPLHGLDRQIARLKSGEDVSPGFLGIRAMKHPDRDGLWIEEVVEDTPAAAAGLEREDTVTKVDGQAVNDMMKFQQLISQYEAGTEIEITYVPDGSDEEKTVKTVLSSPPTPKNAPEPLEPPKIR